MTKLKVGKIAPEFSSTDQNGKPIKLSDFKGKKVVLYFYPKDNTPGCTEQACNLKDNYEALQEKGYVVLGVSRDTAKSHQRFIKQNELPFSLVVDTDLKINRTYDVWGEKMMFGRKYLGTIRTTFLIDENGIIEKIINDVDTENHSTQILN
jgi:peroxiredoxin Q/BCP